MCRLLETIRVRTYRAEHLAWHFRRIAASTGSDSAARAITGAAVQIVREQTGLAIAGPSRYRLRIEYIGDTVCEYSIVPYRPGALNALCVRGPVEYKLKYADRRALDATAAGLAVGVEPLYVSDGRVLETRYANLAFRRKGVWFTPAEVMHEGTTRARLLASGAVRLSDIRLSDLSRFDRICLLNAMLDPGEVGIHPSRVFSLPSGSGVALEVLDISQSDQ
ncbi:MAG: aminotransferase class IV [Spirochaetaceae bacterium]